MTSSNKPIIYLFNGGWFPASVWTGVQAALKARGYEMIVPDLLSSATDGSQAGKSAVDEVRQCHQIVEPLMDAGNTFIVAGWSFGSLPAVMATQGWTVSDREASGKKGGFESIVHIAGLAVLQPNVDFLGAWAGGQAYSRYVDADGNGTLRLNEYAMEDFLNDQDEETRKRWWPDIKTWRFSQATLESPISMTLNHLTIPSTYVVLKNDLGFATQAQEIIAKSHPATRVIEIDSGHCVFLSHEAEVVDVFESVAQRV
ncbi:Alpha/beta hydrolase fold-1 [Mariannaea sp. PMI_226]|nr:Alpha/beta hydrolase fold-1 [Mariannaea sp. PMI_226]